MHATRAPDAPHTQTPADDIAPARPKRGRRRKRPELSNEERRMLRAAQNREATRRSRERVRTRSQQMRIALALSHQHAQALRAERDSLLAAAVVDKSFPPHNERQGAMSLAVILNPPDTSDLHVLRLSSPVSGPSSPSEQASACEFEL